MVIVLRNLRFVKLKGGIRKITIATLGWSTSSWVHVLSVYVQDGFYEAAAVSFLCLGIIGYWIAQTTVPMFVAPLARRAGWYTLERRITGICAMLFIAQVGVSVVSAGLVITTCRDLNPAQFNLWTAMNLGEQCLAVLVGALWVMWTGKRLKTMLPADATSLMTQLRIVISVTYLMVFGSLLIFGNVVAFIVLHSVPYLWISWALMNIVLLLVLSLLVKLASTVGMKSTGDGSATMPKVRARADSDPSTTNGPFSIILPPRIAGLGIRTKKPSKRFVDINLSKISEKEESRVVSVVDKFWVDGPTTFSGS